MSTRDLHEAPFQTIGSKATIQRIRRLNDLLLHRARELAKEGEPTGRIRFGLHDRDGFVSLRPRDAEALVRMPVLLFKPSALSMVDTIAVKPSNNDVEHEITRLWVKAVTDLVHLKPDNKFAIHFLLGADYTELLAWDKHLSDGLWDTLLRTAAIEWTWRMPDPPTPALNQTWDDARQMILLGKMTWELAKQLSPKK